MIIHEIQDLSNSRVVTLLKQAFSQITDDNLIKNYHPDYDYDSGNFFYVLKEGRFNTGKYFVIEEDNNFMVSSGYYSYTDDIALVLTRTYTAPIARHKHYLGKYLIPLMIGQTSHYKKVWTTVNEYNKHWYNWISKSNTNKDSGNKSSLFDGPDYMKPWSKFRPIGKQTVNYVEQYVLELDRSL